MTEHLGLEIAMKVLSRITWCTSHIERSSTPVGLDQYTPGVGQASITPVRCKIYGGGDAKVSTQIDSKIGLVTTFASKSFQERCRLGWYVPIIVQKFEHTHHIGYSQCL